MTTATRRSRVEIAEEVRLLRGRAVHTREIAATLGMSHSYVKELLADPTGEKVRARKRRYHGTCERCGAPTSGSDGRAKAPCHCVPCAGRLKHERRPWKPAAILAAIHGFTAEHGRPPLSTEWLTGPRDPRYPSTATVQSEFGSWSNAIEAAGFPRPAVGRKVVAKMLTCEECGQVFTSVRRTTRYCSRGCNERAWRWKNPRRKTPVERVCVDCGAAFLTVRVGQGLRRYCYDCRPLRWTRPESLAA